VITGGVIPARGAGRYEALCFGVISGTATAFVHGNNLRIVARHIAAVCTGSSRNPPAAADPPGPPVSASGPPPPATAGALRPAAAGRGRGADGGELRETVAAA
jgi:hypothetical protein